ncbi:hypothetical protein Acr_23g0018550 [Actinidia rufa]|uniref:Uncharacterized protein n=1 Tax=Actinidia rufa TaxID=165716 RepID=A0A7J0GRN2_9ERIC|nr:hypothetical protein Acr_23g0018550 [Actinidia rufa]
MPGERKRTVKLFCPTLSKWVPFVAWDEHRLDLGSISRGLRSRPIDVEAQRSLYRPRRRSRGVVGHVEVTPLFLLVTWSSRRSLRRRRRRPHRRRQALQGRNQT